MKHTILGIMLFVHMLVVELFLGLKRPKNHVHCDKCGQAFQSGEMEKHMKVFHEPLRCPCVVVLEKKTW